MPSDALTRDAIVSVLDDLGKREQIRALQFCDLLKQIDGDEETVSAPPTADAA